jgi:hypothetical protein
MINLKLKQNICYAIDLKGIVVINKTNEINLFIKYPEAAVWSVLIGDNTGKAAEMLMAILQTNKVETTSYIDQCLANWRKLNIID